MSVLIKSSEIIQVKKGRQVPKPILSPETNGDSAVFEQYIGKDILHY